MDQMFTSGGAVLLAHLRCRLSSPLDLRFFYLHIVSQDGGAVSATKQLRITESSFNLVNSQTGTVSGNGLVDIVSSCSQLVISDDYPNYLRHHKLLSGADNRVFVVHSVQSVSKTPN